MKKNISFKTWIIVLLGGIRQFIGNIFSWKNRKPVWRFVGVCIGMLALVICFAIGYTIYNDIQCNRRWVQRDDVSSRIQFVQPYNGSGLGWIATKMSGKKLIDNVEWISAPENGDSLVVFSQKGKRGYFNRYTGQVVIPAKYDAAWVFSQGMAAVVTGRNVIFINPHGEKIIDKTYIRDPRLNYVFHGDYCIMNDTDGGIGLIDKTGGWVVNPEYDEIIPAARNYWKMRKDDDETGLWYAFDDKAYPVNMDGVADLDINEDLGVIYTLPNHLKMVIDFDGNRQERFLCQDIEVMYYDTDNRDKDGNLIQERTTLYRYRMSDGYEGLCKANGDIVTEPLYWMVKPIGKDLYHCTYKGTNSGVIINSNGEITQR